MYCQACGATVADGVAFCTSCGRPIVGYSVGGGSAGTYTAGVSAGSASYAGFWLRLVAALLDGVILAIPSWLISFVMFASAVPSMMGRQPDPAEIFAMMLPRLFLSMTINIVGQWLYFSLMESSSWQATLGKKALGLYVTDLEGNRITFARATGRYFAKLISSLTLLIGYIMAGFTEKKQALHDMIAGCLVMRKS
jgi:uncharacterized RDD family membrane protein YckC